ncbi:MAG: cofactor-independent phosphoglycerate mutase [Clostridiales bacterium]|nr:cofactor-independent phosphoglycerate mutase [Clostridiales bacterium]
MKYLVVLCDGMADYKIDALGGKTPMEAAVKPTTDALAKKALVGTVSNVPEGMTPESDTANIAVLSYDPKVYSKGRAPLEAVSMGLTMTDTMTAYRANLVTLSDDEERYEDKIMLDHSADEISTKEADALIQAVEAHFGNDMRHFYTGVSYRHCLLWDHAPNAYDFARPHDILGQCIQSYLPAGKDGAPYLALMEESYQILNHHPINEARRAKGLKPANSLWLWSPGQNPSLPNFQEKWGLDGAVISAVDLIKGIGLCAGLESIDVEGATGNVHTNYDGKATAAIDAFKRGKDFVYIHIEAPDECGHRAEIENKVLSIELIDEKITKPCLAYLQSTGEPFRIMILPDHPTPIVMRTHSMDPVPFFIYCSDQDYDGVDTFTEATAEAKKFYIPHGEQLLDHMIQKEQ